MKIMSSQWFKKERFFFVPVTAVGWLIYATFLVALAFVYTFVNESAGSFQEAILKSLPWWLLIVVVTYLVSWLTSSKH